MLRLMGMKRAAVAAILALSAASGCALHTPPKSVALSTSKATASTLLTERGGAAARLAGNVLILQSVGSTSCPGVVSRVTRRSEHALDIDVWSIYGECTADLARIISRIALPAGMATAKPIEVTIKYSRDKEVVTTKP